MMDDGNLFAKEEVIRLHTLNIHRLYVDYISKKQNKTNNNKKVDCLWTESTTLCEEEANNLISRPS